MRTLHLDSGRWMRGGQRQALYLMEGLAQAGHQVVLLARPGSPLWEGAARSGIEVRRLGVLSIACWSRRMDLTHAHDARSHSLAALAARPPLVVARRVAFPVGRGLLSRWKYGRAARYIAISQAARGTLLAAGIPAERISVVYDGVRLPERVAEPGEAGRLVAPATDDPRKGSALVRQAAEMAGVEVHFSSDLETDLPAARAFLYISSQEGLGSAVLLAMAHGVPVVASRVGGLTEAIEPETSGLLVENTPAAIAQAIRRLGCDGGLARRLAEGARQRAERLFPVSAMVEGTLRVYREVLSC